MKYIVPARTEIVKVSGPARALGIEMSFSSKMMSACVRSGPARALGIEILLRVTKQKMVMVGACEGPGD